MQEVRCCCQESRGQHRAGDGRHRAHSAITATGKADSTGEVNLIYCQSNRHRIMRNKDQIVKHLCPTSPFFPGLTSLPTSPPPPPKWRREHREWGLWSVHHMLSLLLLPPCSLPLLQHGRQSSTNCPSMGPFHRVQSFRNRLLQRGSPAGSQVLLANLLRRGLLSPRVHRSWQEPA